MKRLVTWGLLGLWLSLLCGAEVWAQAAPTAQLTRVQGVVKLMRRGTGRWHQVRQPADCMLYPGDHVQTGQRSRATILIQGARIELTPGAHVVIPASQQARKAPRGLVSLFALAGRVFVWLIGSTGLELGTEGAVAGAEGTQFLLEVTAEGATVVTVYEGQVRFYNELGEVMVQAGERSQATKTTAPTRPQRVDVTGTMEWEATLQDLYLGWDQRYNPAAGRDALKSQSAPSGDDAAAKTKAGQALHDLGDFKGAEEQFQGALGTAPNSAAALTGLGHALLAQGLVADAGAAFDKAAQAEPGNADALVGRALVLASGGGPEKLAQARALLNAANQGPALALAGLLAMRAGDAAAAADLLQRGAQAGSFQARAYLAALHLAQGQADAARQAAQQAVQAAPASPLAQESLAAVEFYAGDLAQAQAAAAAALEANPQSAGARLLAAQVALAQGDLDTGLEQAEYSVTLDPSSGPAYTTLGLVFLARQELRSAQKAFNHALACDPKLVSAQTGLGTTYSRMGKLREAMALQQAAVALDPNRAAVHNNLGAAYLAAGKLDQAEAEFQQALKLQPDWGLAHANLALTWLEMNQYAQAVQEGEKAVSLGEKSARLRVTLGRVYLKQNRILKAWAVLRQARELDPDDAQTSLYLAEVDRRLGRNRDSLRETLAGVTRQPSAMLDDRDYARTVVQASAGTSWAARARVDGRANDGANSYYLAAGHETSDFDRDHSTWRQSTLLGVAGTQPAKDRVQAGLFSAQWEVRDRPGMLTGDGPEDPDYRSRFSGYEMHYLDRRDLGGGDLLLRLGYRHATQQEENPDSLLADAKPFRSLRLGVNGPSAEARYDTVLRGSDRLTAGVAYADQRRWVSGEVGTAIPPAAPTFEPFSDRLARDMAAGYVDYDRRLSASTRLLVGGKMAVTDDTRPVMRPRAALRKQMGHGGTLVLLTRPVLADDVTEISPVEQWALADWMSPLDLARGGWAQSYEVQYERLVDARSLLRLGVYQRDIRSLLVDLQDPELAPGAAPSLVVQGRLRGVQVEAERWLGRDLTAGVLLVFNQADNRDNGLDLPYQPEMLGQVRLDYLSPSGWRGAVVYNHVGRRYADLAAGTRLGSYDTVDLYVAKQQTLHTDLFLSIRNLLDEADGFYGGYPSAGMKFQAGVERRF